MPVLVLRRSRFLNDSPWAYCDMLTVYFVLLCRVIIRAVVIIRGAHVNKIAYRHRVFDLMYFDLKS